MRRTVPHPEVVLENLLRQNFDIGKHRELQLAHAALTQYTASGGQDFRNETLATVAKRAGLRPTVLTSKRTPFTVLVRAHRAYSNAIEVPHDTHPNGTLDSLLAQGFRPERQFNLRRLGDFCERQHRKGPIAPIDLVRRLQAKRTRRHQHRRRRKARRRGETHIRSSAEPPQPTIHAITIALPGRHALITMQSYN